jgi:hypothetical protein
MPGAKRCYRKNLYHQRCWRELVSYLTAQLAMSLSQACRKLSLSRTVYFYQNDTHRDEMVIQELAEMVECYPRYGFKKLFQVLRR